MKNYVKSSTNKLTFSYDYSKQRYTFQLLITNIHQDKQILTKVYLNTYTNFSVSPVVLYTNPGETKSILIERNSASIDQKKKEKFITYSIQLDTPVNSYEEAKEAFKAIDYLKEGQKIEYTTEYLLKENITFNSSDITKDTKKDDIGIENVKRESDDVQRKIAEKEKSIKALEQKLELNCRNITTNKGLINNSSKDQKKDIKRNTVSFVALIGLILLSFVLGASFNK